MALKFDLPNVVLIDLSLDKLVVLFVSRRCSLISFCQVFTGCNNYV